MLLSFDLTVSALAESIIRERCPGADPGADASHGPVAGFLLESCSRMPDYLKLPFRCLTLVFDAWALPSSGRAFHRLPHDGRWRQILAWQESALGFRRDLIQYYETLTIFGWYAERYQGDYTHAGES